VRKRAQLGLTKLARPMLTLHLQLSEIPAINIKLFITFTNLDFDGKQ